MRLIDADVLIERLRELEDLADPERGNKAIEFGDLHNAIAGMDTVEPEPARLLTEEDFVDNPDVDSWGYLPVWEEEWGPEPGEWGYADRADVVIKGTTRYWTRRPTQEQMDETPWEE